MLNKLLDSLEKYSNTELIGERGPYKPIGSKSIRWIKDLFDYDKSMIDVGQLIESGKKVSFFSDPHLDHANIIRLCDRPFLDLKSMQDTLWSNIVKAVNTSDLTICVGDIGIKEPLLWQKRFFDLGNIYTIVGNHDAHNWEPLKWSKLNGRSIGYFRLSTEYVLNLIKNDDDFKYLDIDKLPDFINFGIMHWPVPIEFLPSHFILIHGHTHKATKLPGHINVCMENINYTPTNFNDLINVELIDEFINNIKGVLK